MAVLVGESNMWSRKHLQRKLVEKYGDSVNIQIEGSKNMIQFLPVCTVEPGDNIQILLCMCNHSEIC